MRLLRIGLLVVVALGGSAPRALSQGNGNLQIHFMNVGQGDGALLISPLGETVLFDNGLRNNCNEPVSYLTQVSGLVDIDYHVASHYHDDHIGCAQEVFSQFPLQVAAYDRGSDYHTQTYNRYVTQVGALRREVEQDFTVTLDAGFADPVAIEFVAANGNGHPTSNENDRSVVAVVRFGVFDAVFGGDLSGEDTSHYRDVETHVAPSVGRVEVYKVNHHGSQHSTNGTWLTTLAPMVGIISTGTGNTHGHPHWLVLETLHTAGVQTYWTEQGAGVAPEPGLDVIGGDIVIQAAPGAATFTITHSGNQTDTFTTWENGGSPPVGQPPFS